MSLGVAVFVVAAVALLWELFDPSASTRARLQAMTRH
jgi:cytochrome b561